MYIFLEILCVDSHEVTAESPTKHGRREQALDHDPSNVIPTWHLMMSSSTRWMYTIHKNTPYLLTLS